MTQFATQTLADIASTLPGATAIFRRHKLDFCCGGRISLAEAAGAKNLPLDSLEGELGALTPALAIAPESTDSLIAHIIVRYHDVHRRELPELIRLARRVEAVHKAHPDAPAGLADLLERMQAELEDHMAKEEQVLFPLMRQGGHPMIGHPISMMMTEHDSHGELLHALEDLTDDFTVPEDGCPTWRALYVGAGKLADDLMQHIHTENNILFPRFLG